jgi:hypothetical protein
MDQTFYTRRRRMEYSVKRNLLCGRRCVQVDLVQILALELGVWLYFARPGPDCVNLQAFGGPSIDSARFLGCGAV